MKKQMIALCTCIVLLLTSCTAPPTAPSSAPPTPVTAITDEQLAEAVAKAYTEVPEEPSADKTEWLGQKQVQKLLDAIAPSGVVAAGYHTVNRGKQQIIDLVATAKAGGSGEAVVCWNFRVDSVLISRLPREGGPAAGAPRVPRR